MDRIYRNQIFNEMNQVNLSDVAWQRATKYRQRHNISSENKWPIVNTIRNLNNNPNISDKLESQHAIKNMDREDQKKQELFGDVGISTLMDISLSTIKNSTLRHKKLPDSVPSSLQTPDPQLIKLKQRLQSILKTPLNLNLNINPAFVHTQKICEQTASPDPFLAQIRQAIRGQQLTQACNLIRKVMIKSTYKELYLYDTLKMLNRRRRLNIKTQVFEAWRVFVQDQGDKKIIMNAIRDRIIKRRNIKNDDHFNL